jgi:hypothetical protein
VSGCEDLEDPECKEIARRVKELMDTFEKSTEGEEGKRKKEWQY